MKRYMGRALLMIALGIEFSCNAATATAPLAFTVVSATPATSTVGGTITVTVTGGVAPYTFNLNGVNLPGQPQTSPTAVVTGLTTASQAITVTDSATPQNTTFIALTIATLPSVMVNGITFTQPSVFGGTNGSLNFSTLGGTTPITFTLTNTSGYDVTQIGNGLFTNLAANGEYTIIASSSGFLSGEADFPLAQPFPVLFTTSVTPTSTVNNTPGSIVVTVIGGTGPYTVTLKPNGLAPVVIVGTPTQTVFPFNGLPANTYTVTVVDVKGLTQISTVTVPATRGTSTNPITNFITTALCAGG